MWGASHLVDVALASHDEPCAALVLEAHVATLAWQYSKLEAVELCPCKLLERRCSVARASWVEQVHVSSSLRVDESEGECAAIE